MPRICVFCGSKGGNRPAYELAVRATGKELVRRGLGLVYGGGHIGLMGALADAALEAGGEVIGVIPQFMVTSELAHRGLTRLHVVETMHQRKALMADLSDAFLAMPGGFGTCDELFEILTWGQLHIHRKPIGLLNVEGYFDGLLAWVNHCVAEGFVKPAHRDLLQSESTCTLLLDRIVPQITRGPAGPTVPSVSAKLAPGEGDLR